MNAIRSLPLINRPSRTSTPVPTATATGPATVQPLGPPPVPVGRGLPGHPVAPVAAILTPASAPRSQSAGRKAPSPPLSRAQTPRSAATPLPASGAETPQGGHVDAIGLRLNEIVNKACLGVDAKAKKGFRKGAGWSVGESIANELPPIPADPYLVRAILRTVVRSLSIYVSRLDSLLLPVLSDPQFAAALNLTHLVPPNTSPLNATQLFAVSVAHCAWETCECLEQMLETGKYPRFVEDTLRPTMDKFDLVVGKVVRPILLAVKVELESSISKTHGVAPKAPAGPATVPAMNTSTIPITRERSGPGGVRLTKESSGSGHPRQQQISVPCCLQQFASRVDLSRKVFEVVAGPCSHDGEGWVAKVMVSTVWRGIRVITENDINHHLNRTPSPGSVQRALSGLGKEAAAAPAVAPSPSLAKMASLGILPSRSASRPPSPPHGTKYDPATHALMSFEGLVKRLVGGLVQPPTAAPAAVDSDDQAAEMIAREAMAEAMEALESAIIVSIAVHGAKASTRILASVRRLRDDIDDTLEEKLDDALEDLPSVSLFGIILRRANAALALIPATSEKDTNPLRIREPAEIWGWTVTEYDRQVLSGFGSAEEWGPRVARALKPEIETMLSRLATVVAAQGDKAQKDTVEASEWVNALGVACEARAGVKVARAT